MAKRFTDTEKWKKPFIRGLKAPYKLLWFYIWDECDHAGLWQVDFEVAQLKIGEKLKKDDAINFFADKITVIENGEIWFIPSFIEQQYSELSEINRAHTKVIFLLKKYNLIDNNLSIIKPLTSPLQGDKEEEEEKKEEEEQEKDTTIGFAKIILPWLTDSFLECWSTWKEYKKKEKQFVYKTELSEQAALNKLLTLSGGVEDVAISIVKESIANGWDGLFELKNTYNANRTSNSRTPAGAARIDTGKDFRK